VDVVIRVGVEEARKTINLDQELDHRHRSSAPITLVLCPPVDRLDLQPMPPLESIDVNY
jgi:hypothetical protein